MAEYRSNESSIGIRGYRTPEILGLGGRIKKYPFDFIVREIPPNGNPIFNGSEVGEDLGGMFIHCVLQKENLDTYSAIKKISNFLGVPEDNFGYAGLKDSKAITYQRISIWNVSIEQVQKVNIPCITLLQPIRQKFAIKIGDLEGNYFQITLRDVQNQWDNRTWRLFTDLLNKNGLLNYYGVQRFGSKRPVLHLIGKLLLQERYDDVIDTYVGTTNPLENPVITALRHQYKQYRENNSFRSKDPLFPRKFVIENKILSGLKRNKPAKTIVLSLPMYFLRLALSAFQSFLFNELLSYLNEIEAILDQDTLIPLLGYQSYPQNSDEIIWNKLLDLLNHEELHLQNFKHPHPKLRSKGSLRKALVFPQRLEYTPTEKGNDTIKVSFSLPKGSYATILTRELIK